MGGHPPEADWELVVGRDLVAHLLPAGRLCGVRRPGDVAWLPDGAYQALVDSVGCVGLEDLLVVPAVAWPAERWRLRQMPSRHWPGFPARNPRVPGCPQSVKRFAALAVRLPRRARPKAMESRTERLCR